MQLEEIQQSIELRRNRIFLLMEEVRRLRIQQRVKVTLPAPPGSAVAFKLSQLCQISTTLERSGTQQNVANMKSVFDAILQCTGTASRMAMVIVVNSGSVCCKSVAMHG